MARMPLIRRDGTTSRRGRKDSKLKEKPSGGCPRSFVSLRGRVEIRRSEEPPAEPLRTPLDVLCGARLA